MPTVLKPVSDMIKRTNNSELAMWRDYLMGVTKVRQDQYASAFEYLNSALMKAELRNDNLVKMGVFNQLVNVSYYMQDYEKSLDYNRKLFSLSRSLNDSFSEVMALSNEMNIYYMKTNQQKKAIDNAETEEDRLVAERKFRDDDQKTKDLQEEVLGKSREIGAFHHEIRALIMLQNRYDNEKKFRQAVQVAERTVALARRHKLVYEEAVSYNNMGISLRSLGEHEKGLAALRHAERLYKKINSQQSMLWVLEDYATAYEHNRQYDKALEYQKKYHDASMELMQKTNNKKVLELQEKFDHNQKEREIEKLKQKNDLNAAKLGTERLQRTLYTVIIAALIVITGIQFNRHKAIQAKKEKLDLLTDQLKEQSLKDPLTGLNNRRLLQEVQGKMAANCLRSLEKYPHIDASIGIVLVDIDHFKKVNDTYGHDVGDRVLQAFAKNITTKFRKGDVAIRWGGEEFLVILNQINQQGVEQFCRRMLTLCNETEIKTAERPLKITCSMGYTMFPFSVENLEWMNWDESLKLVDNLMYLAKSQGRNKAVTCSLVSNAMTEEHKRELIQDLPHSNFSDSKHIFIKMMEYHQMSPMKPGGIDLPETV